MVPFIIKNICRGKNVGMFRGTGKSIMNSESFGAGSTIKDSKNTYLVVSNADNNQVYLICLNTMEMLPKSVNVEDVNYMSQTETRDLVNNNLTDAFSDYEFIPAGLKEEWCL